MTQKKLNELNILKGDAIFLKGKKRHETLCIALTDNTLTDDKIRMNKVIRKNLRVRLGGNLLVKGFSFNHSINFEMKFFLLLYGFMSFF